MILLLGTCFLYKRKFDTENGTEVCTENSSDKQRQRILKGYYETFDYLYAFRICSHPFSFIALFLFQERGLDWNTWKQVPEEKSKNKKKQAKTAKNLSGVAWTKCFLKSRRKHTIKPCVLSGFNPMIFHG